MNIPLAKPNVSQFELEAIAPVLESGWLGMGPLVKDFETRVCDFVGCDHCVAVNTGTSALHLALEVVGVEGREVIVPSMTYAATIQAILMARGVPVFCECRESDLNMDVDDAMKRVTRKTKVIMPVHYAGKPVDMNPLLTFCESRGIHVVEDAAHAFGSTLDGKPIGSFGHLTCFSFDPIKTITCGEGGAICTANDAWNDALSTSRVLGISKNTWDRYQTKRPWTYEVVSTGYRYHLSNINAAIGLEQMKRVESLIGSRRRAARYYQERLCDVRDIALLDQDFERIAPFCFTFRVLNGKRDEFMLAIRESGIGVSVLYLPNHTQPFFKKYGEPLPITEGLSEQYVSIPLFADMTLDQLETVVDRVKSFFG